MVAVWETKKKKNLEVGPTSGGHGPTVFVNNIYNLKFGSRKISKNFANMTHHIPKKTRKKKKKKVFRL